VASWKHVETYYVKHGEPTSEQDNIRQALRFVRKQYGTARAADFGTLALQAVRDAMIRHPVTRKVKVTDEATGEVRLVEKLSRVGLAREFINKQISRVRGMFRWAVSQQLVPVDVYQALLTVADLRKDHTTAREKPPVRPAPGEHVELVLGKVPAVVAAMVRVQLLSGGRPQDVVNMRVGDLDRRGEAWEYRPGRHKTEHLDLERVLYLGPKASPVKVMGLSVRRAIVRWSGARRVSFS
jgi:integrase